MGRNFFFGRMDPVATAGRPNLDDLCKHAFMDLVGQVLVRILLRQIKLNINCRYIVRSLNVQDVV